MLVIIMVSVFVQSFANISQNCSTGPHEEGTIQRKIDVLEQRLKGDIEVSILRPDSSVRGKFKSFVHDGAGIPHGVIVSTNDGVDVEIQDQDIGTIKASADTWRVRGAAGVNLPFELVDEAERIANAKARLEKDRFRLLTFDKERVDDIVRNEMKFLENKIAKLRSTYPGLGIEETRSVIVVSDFGIDREKYRTKLVAGVQETIAEINWGSKKTPFETPVNGKPIIIVATTDEIDSEFKLDVVRSELDSYLKNRNFLELPQVVVEQTEGFNNHTVFRIARSVAIDQVSLLYSDKPLPAWLHVGFVNFYLRLTFPSEFSSLKIVRTPDSLKMMMQTNDLNSINDNLALDITQELIFRNPSSFSELIFDLKHGLPLEEALQRNLKTDIPSIVKLAANRLNIVLPPEFQIE